MVGVIVAIIGLCSAIVFAIWHNLSIKRLQKKIDDPFSKGLNLIGEHKWSEAIRELREAMKEGKAIYLVKFCNLIGLCYYALNELDSAFESYYLSLNLAKNLNDKNGEASARSSLGLIFKNRGEKEKALRYFEEALEIFTQIGAQREAEEAKRGIQILKT